ncbi:MAG: NADH-quinone oxidoreductase subunit E [Pseudomonadota bacterium]
MLRRLHHTQPDSFAFTPENLKWAEAQIAKYPEGRQASAVIPLLWRAQEQEGWISRPVVETVADMLGMADIRVLEVATFYFMFQMKPVGEVAHFQICGTTSCMICGAEDLIAVCRDKIAPTPHTLSADGKFSWEEVECLGACANAPMAQIGKDYYEDLTADRFAEIIDEFAAGEVPAPGPQNGRYASEPAGGLTSLDMPKGERVAENASKELARALGDTVARITDGRGISRPTGDPGPPPEAKIEATPTRALEAEKGAAGELKAKEAARPAPAEPDDEAEVEEAKPETLSAPRDGGADDLKRIKGVGPKLETTLNELGFYHFDQIAAWTEAEVAWVDTRLKFKGRIQRDGWIAQAADLAAKRGG